MKKGLKDILKSILLESKNWCEYMNKPEIVNVEKLEKGRDMSVGNTSYLRYMDEPCLLDARKADIKTMEMLGISKLNPLYLLEVSKHYFDYIYAKVIKVPSIMPAKTRSGSITNKKTLKEFIK
jgi:hypothetical protein